jgi:hypothetical protein
VVWIEKKKELGMLSSLYLWKVGEDSAVAWTNRTGVKAFYMHHKTSLVSSYGSMKANLVIHSYVV